MLSRIALSLSWCYTGQSCCLGAVQDSLELVLVLYRVPEYGLGAFQDCLEIVLVLSRKVWRLS